MLVQITREDDYRGPRGITAPSESVREEYEAKCQTCGLCCCHPLTKADGPSEFSYFGAQEVTYRWWHGEEQTDKEEGYWMQMKDGQCIALEGNPGSRVRCTIYVDRPSTCRLFEAGSDACLHLRDRAGIPR